MNFLQSGRQFLQALSRKYLFIIEDVFGRHLPGSQEKPTTSELHDCIKLRKGGVIGPETLRERDPKKLIPPLHGALLKNEQDVHLFERLAFMTRRDGR